MAIRIFSTLEFSKICVDGALNSTDFTIYNDGDVIFQVRQHDGGTKDFIVNITDLDKIVKTHDEWKKIHNE